MIVTWQQIPSPIVTEILCQSFDGVVLDLEHGVFNNETISSCIQVATLMQRKILVRITCIDKRLIRMCLDCGVSGIILSTVEDKKEADELRNICLYKYSRGQGLVRQNKWNDSNLIMNRTNSDLNLMLIPQIETSKGIINLSDIMHSDFTQYLVGPYDLSASLNCIGNFTDRRYIDGINYLKQQCKDKLTYHFVKDVQNNISFIEEMKPHTHKIVGVGMDTLMLKQVNLNNL